jgi:DNA-binding transcriptional regulator YiaG
MKTILPKSPTKQHWEMLQNLPKDRLMTPEQFLTYWSIGQKEMALITGASLQQVKNWWCGRTKPPVEAMRRLSVVHSLWTKISQS